MDHVIPITCSSCLFEWAPGDQPPGFTIKADPRYENVNEDTWVCDICAKSLISNATICYPLNYIGEITVLRTIGYAANWIVEKGKN